MNMIFCLLIWKLSSAPLARRTAWLLILTLLLVLIWAIIGKLDIHASASGKVIVAEHSKIIQPAEPGVVTEINVRDGDTVDAGQVLIALNPIGIDAKYAISISNYSIVS